MRWGFWRGYGGRPGGCRRTLRRCGSIMEKPSKKVMRVNNRYWAPVWPTRWFIKGNGTRLGIWWTGWWNRFSLQDPPDYGNPVEDEGKQWVNSVPFTLDFLVGF